MSEAERIRKAAEKSGLVLYPGQYARERKRNVSQEVLVARHSEEVVRMLNEGKQVGEVAAEFGTSIPTMYRAARQIGRWVFWPWPRGFRGPYPPHRTTEPPRGGGG